MSSVLGVPVYFAHPHSPWERRSNENTNGLLNGLLREFLPKGKDFRSASREALDKYVSLLKERATKVRQMAYDCGDISESGFTSVAFGNL